MENAHTPSRRSLIVVSGLVALLSGVGAAHWFRNRNRLPIDAEEALWDQELELTDGSPLKLKAWRGKPLVLNFWATWCPPCVEEMPLLDASSNNAPSVIPSPWAD